MNRALWKKTFAEARWLLLASAALMFCIHWLRVWLTSQLPLKKLKQILDLMPETWTGLLPVPKEQIATHEGRIAIAYDDPIVLLIVAAWAISRGSDAIAGELGRGTMEMLLAQPVRRLSVLTSQAGMTLLGAALLALAAWLGTWTGVNTVTLEQEVSAAVFIPAALNLFAVTVFLAGLSTALSSLDRYRWRTIGLVGGFFAVQMVMKLVGRLAKDWDWLLNWTFLTAFEPQLLVSDPSRTWAWWVEAPDGSLLLGGLGYDAVLIGLGLVGYLVAAVVFARRDLPAPL